jgi:hypothetical protein
MTQAASPRRVVQDRRARPHRAPVPAVVRVEVGGRNGVLKTHRRRGEVGLNLPTRASSAARPTEIGCVTLADGRADDAIRASFRRYRDESLQGGYGLDLNEAARVGQPGDDLDPLGLATVSARREITTPARPLISEAVPGPGGARCLMVCPCPGVC